MIRLHILPKTFCATSLGTFELTMQLKPSSMPRDFNLHLSIPPLPSKIKINEISFCLPEQMVKKGHPWRQSGPAPKKLPMYYSGRRRVFFLQTQFFKHLLQVSLIFCFSIELSLYTYNFLLCPGHKNSHWRYSNERCLICVRQILKIQLIFTKQRRNRVSKSVVKPNIWAITWPLFEQKIA